MEINRENIEKLTVKDDRVYAVVAGIEHDTGCVLDGNEPDARCLAAIAVRQGWADDLPEATHYIRTLGKLSYPIEGEIVWRV